MSQQEKPAQCLKGLNVSVSVIAPLGLTVLIETDSPSLGLRDQQRHTSCKHKLTAAIKIPAIVFENQWS